MWNSLPKFPLKKVDKIPMIFCSARQYIFQYLNEVAIYAVLFISFLTPNLFFSLYHQLPSYAIADYQSCKVAASI